LMGNPWERGQLKDLAVDGRMILKWIFKKWDGNWSIWLRIGIGVGICGCGNEYPVFIKCGKFPD
jgi:hypothetical protein